MIDGPPTLPLRTVGEWTVPHAHALRTPFADLALTATFTGPSGQVVTVPGYFDGGETWKVRFNPSEAGSWRWRFTTVPAAVGFVGEGSLEVTARATRGFLRATPGKAWGFAFEDGSPAFILGDTVYNLFGMAVCGGDVEGFLRRRAAQGFNLMRIRIPVTPFHPPAGDSEWQDRSIPVWGGSVTAPRFDQLNLDYFRVVDRVVQLCEELGMGIEMIMEGWGFEYPFNSRSLFTAEWEELYMRFLIARYDAFNCLWLWTPLNEYEYYPNGDWNYKPVADRWALRVARWIKATAGHGHAVAMHNGPRLPPFADRFRADPGAVDAIMYQEWGDRSREGGWLATGIEESIGRAFKGWPGSVVFAEWGYERNPAFALKVPSHEFCDRDHTRRGAWRGVFRGMGIIHGFENSWGPWMLLEEDQPGLADLVVLHRFLTRTVSFADLRPNEGLVASRPASDGQAPRCLASDELDVILVYLPAGGGVEVVASGHRAQWLDPRTGALSPAGAGPAYEAPEVGDPQRPHDWVLVLRAS